MPPYAVHCAACAADKSLLSVSRLWTGCSCHCRCFALLARPKLLNSTDLLGNTDTIFFPNRPSPFHCSHLPVPSLCPLLGLQFLSWVCLTLPWQQRREKLPAHSPSLWFLFFFLSRSFIPSPLSSYSGRVNGTMAALAVKDLYLSQLHALCVFFFVVFFFSVLPGECHAGKGAREADGFKEQKESKSVEETNTVWWRDPVENTKHRGWSNKSSYLNYLKMTHMTILKWTCEYSPICCLCG